MSVITAEDRGVMMEWLQIVQRIRESLEHANLHNEELNKTHVGKVHPHWTDTDELIFSIGTVGVQLACDDDEKGYRSGYGCLIPKCSSARFTARCSFIFGLRCSSGRYSVRPATNWKIDCYSMAGRGPGIDFWLCSRHLNGLLACIEEWKDEHPSAECETVAIRTSAVETILPLLFKLFVPDMTMTDICSLILSYYREQ